MLETGIPIFLGTLQALTGFVIRRPGTFRELICPRFVIPCFFWLTTFAQYFLPVSPPIPILLQVRRTHATEALWFCNACLAAFWVAYIFFPQFRQTRSIDNGTVTLRQVRFMATMSGLAVPLLLFLPSVDPNLQLASRKLVIPTCILGAVCIGVLWAKSSGRHIILRLTCAALLATFSYPFMATFSRGSGIPVFTAVLSYSAVSRVFRPLLILLAGLFLMAAGQIGLSGRAVHGHYAGLTKYATHATHVSKWLGRDANPTKVLTAGDKLTAVCLSIEIGKRNARVGQLSSEKWILRHVPLPSFVGLPEWTVYLPHFIIRQRTEWNYTTGTLGDLHLHFGFWGSLFFVILGAFYKTVERIAFDSLVRGSDGAQGLVVRWELLFLFGGYFAFVMASFNNCRSWVVLTTLSCLFLFVARRVFHHRRQCSYSISQPGTMSRCLVGRN
jgi:hypothetical protein